MRHALNVLLAIHAMHAYIIAPTVRVALNMRGRLGRCTAIGQLLELSCALTIGRVTLNRWRTTAVAVILSGNACKLSVSGHLRDLQKTYVHVWLADNI
jgi:hypothetical protein